MPFDLWERFGAEIATENSFCWEPSPARWLARTGSAGRPAKGPDQASYGSRRFLYGVGC
jgi:hypothetical protein